MKLIYRERKWRGLWKSKKTSEFVGLYNYVKCSERDKEKKRKKGNQKEKKKVIKKGKEVSENRKGVVY